MSEDELMRRMHRLVTELCFEEVKFLAMWRSTYPYAFAALLSDDEEGTKRQYARMRTIVKGFDKAKKSTHPMWQGVVKQSGLSWLINQESFELFQEEDFKLGPRSTKQIRRLFTHMMSSLLSERGFKWMRDSQRDNNNAAVGEMTLWECPSRRKVLEDHGFQDIPTNHIRDVGHQSVDKSFFGPPIFSKNSDSFKDIPGRGKAPWHSAKPEDIFHAGVMTDYLWWSMENGKMDKVNNSWRTSCVQHGTLLHRADTSDAKFFVVGKALNMMYLWPAVMEKIGKSDFWSYADGGIDLLKPSVVLDFDDWEVTPTTCVSPAHIFILNGRKTMEELPILPVVRSGDPTSLLRAAALSAFAGMPKATILKLDKEEVEAIGEETKLGDILMAMIMKVLDVSRAKAADILAQRCIRVSSDERREMVGSEAFSEIVDEKKEVADIAKALDSAELQADECAEAVRAERQAAAKKKCAKKAKLAEKVWPKDNDFSLPRLQSVQPPGASLWYDPSMKRYQIFLAGSSLSRATRLHGQVFAAKECTRWAWTMHQLLQDDGGCDCPIKGLFDG